jgi:hypothetical protein
MKPVEIIAAFDRYLAARQLELDAVVVGGTALNLLGIIDRPTKDCDVLHPELPAAVLAAARSFAREVRARGEALDDDWLNNGPAALIRQLPPTWQQDLQTVFRGAAISLQSLGRLDQLRAKLFALCDRGIDLGDCVALAPTRDELALILPWVAEQDANPDWPAHVRATLEDLGRRLGHGI